MAAASVSFSTPLRTPGSRRQAIVDFTPSTSYPANGEPFDTALLGLSAVDTVVPLPPSDGSRLVTYDPTNKTIRIYTAIGTEAGTGTDQSAKVIRVLVLGL